MATKATKATKRAKRKGGRPAYVRRTYMLDEETIADSGLIQQGLRASTASEAVRYAIRQMAALMRCVNDGYSIQATPPSHKENAWPVVLDIPGVRSETSS